MTLSTTSCALHITPTVLKTLTHHYALSERRKRRHRKRIATDDILFDEAFHIVKRFIVLGTHNTVDDLQKFTNTHVPSPYWSAVAPVLIPLRMCNVAADILIQWFDPRELKDVVGGERWWQVRGLDGIDAEWITEKSFLNKHADRLEQERQKRREEGKEDLIEAESDILEMEHLERVMFYIHGGAYFWGSINTHRYQIQRYARQMGGRAFAVNYRKSPQYPWPCPLQDVLTGYLYLTQPPPNALHKPVSASNIVMAGDSAGAALALSLLVVLRDMDLPLPAGAVLISPWVDLTHSFPSVMSNMDTDIIPPHGFVHKPSTTWPVTPLPPADPNISGDRARVATTTTKPPPEPGHADTLTPNLGRLRQEETGGIQRDGSAERNAVGTQEEMLREADNSTAVSSQSPRNGSANTRASSGEQRDGHNTFLYNRANLRGELDNANADSKTWEPKPPKVLMEDKDATPLELRSQIQLYATNEQLTHSLVSPVLQSSLGNLCPLYIIAGDKELLRDEIMYIAHKASHPDAYPTRSSIVEEVSRQKDNLRKFTKPTKVHLQVFDDMCHVLTVFTFTPAAHYAYRAIAQFVKHVTDHSAEHLERNPFPELHPRQTNLSRKARDKTRDAVVSHGRTALRTSEGDEQLGNEVYAKNAQRTQQEVEEEMKGIDILPSVKEDMLKAAQERDIQGALMIRERVNVFGFVRVMEPIESIPALSLSPEEIGIIKEKPVRRWQAGQDEWDRIFKGTARRVIKQRRKFQLKADRFIATARENGFRHETDQENLLQTQTISSRASTVQPARGEVQDDRRWGPLDLEDETPPSSAIAKRRDSADALALIKKSLYYTAPATHRRIPKLTKRQIFKATFDPKDDPFHPPKQSVSEQQAAGVGLHGLQMWSSMMSYFVRFTSRKATKQFEAASNIMCDSREQSQR